MLEFLDAITSFPTAVFSALLALVAGYWLLVIVGAVDLDAFDGLDAAAEALDVSAEGAIDVGDAPGGLGIVNALGMRDVPITLWLSVLVLVAWLASLAGMELLGGPLGALAPPVVLALALGAGVAATSVAVRPLRPIFRSHTAVSHRALVGKTCTITTLRVDGEFGQALIDDGAAGLLVQVRCADENDLTRGSHALIFDYRPDEGAFHVARYDEPAADLRG